MTNEKPFMLCILAMLAFNLAQAKGKNFSSIELRYESTDQLTLGQTIRIGIVALNDKGKEFKTPGFLSPGLLKSVDWTNFNIEVEGGIFKDGSITLSDNARDIKNHGVKIMAYCVKDPEVKAELSIPLNYKGKLLVNMDGEAGKDGQKGKDGAMGPSTTNASTSLHGGNGGSGGKGTDGKNGPDVDVYITLKEIASLKKEMIYILVINKNTSEEKIAIADPGSSEVTISINGGRGGNGGGGGNGGKGGQNDQKDISGNGGNGGEGGQAGNGGNGGSATVYMDPSTDKVHAVINFSNEGGKAGRGGEGGTGGAKGLYASNYGAKGTTGTHGSSGEKGAEPKVIKQKVEIED